MKVLVIDNNAVTREAITEILTASKYEVEKSSDTIDSISKLSTFMPEIVVLSTKAGENDVEILTAISKLTGSHVLLLTDTSEHIVKNDIIAGCLEKPFGNVDVINKVNDIANEIRKKDRSFLVRLFTRESKSEGIECNFPNFEFGKSYVIFEKEPSTIYKVIEYFTTKNCNVFIATEKFKLATEKFKDNVDKIKFLKLSVEPHTDHVEVSKLGTITDLIKKFIIEKERPVVVFDEFLTVIKANGLNNSMTMLYQVLNSGIKKRISLILSTDDNALANNDRELFLHNMKQYGIQGDFDEN